MDFFQRQDKARSHTVLLTVLFLLGLLATAFLIHLVIRWTLLFLLEDENRAFLETSQGSWSFFALDMICVCGFVALVALFKVTSLNKAGSDGIAVSLGGKLVTRGDMTPCSRRLYNVVEEIAIASGAPIPRVYILEHENSINACAIGTSPENAAICVTQGALNYLTRDELQGVVAHEFSHIVNNDVSLNTRLIGYLFGLEIIALIAAFIFRLVLETPIHSTSSSSKKDEGGGTFAAILFVLFVSGTLFVIGYIGILFGNIIRSAISRQREYLADASAVQFTRNPAGIAGALKKIGCPSLGSHIDNSKSVQASHMFFGSVFSQSFLQSLFQTHPSLDLRIKAIDPTFNGVFPTTVQKNDWAAISKQEFVPDQSGGHKYSLRDLPEQYSSAIAGLASEVVSAPGSVAGSAEEVVNIPTSGIPRHSSIASKRQKYETTSSGEIRVDSAVLQEVPKELEDFLLDFDSAKAVFYSVLLGEDRNEKRLQRQIVESVEEKAFCDIFEQTCRMVEPLGDAARLVLARKAAPLLKTGTIEQYRSFRTVVIKLCNTDGVLDLFEYTIQASTIREMDLYYRLAKERKVLYTSFDQIAPYFATVLSYLAYRGAARPGDEYKAFQDGIDSIGVKIDMVPEKDCTLSSCSRALNALYVASPGLKKTILRAFYVCVFSDNVVTESEAAIVSAVTASLGAPAPIWKNWNAV